MSFKQYLYSALCLCIVMSSLSYYFLTPSYTPAENAPTAFYYPDGIYTGEYKDNNCVQIRITFELKEQTFLWLKFQTLQYKDGNYLSAATQTQKDIAGQFAALTDFLTHKSISAITSLYHPGTIAADTDAVSGATLKASKLIWAIWDALEADSYKQHQDCYENGTYRGFAYQDDAEQIALQFVIIDGKFQSFTYRTLFIDGQDYLSKTYSENMQCTLSQYMELTHTLIGQPVSAVNRLTDRTKLYAFSDKLAEAILNGLQHHPYVCGEAAILPIISANLDGKYTAVSSQDFISSFQFHFQIKDGKFQQFQIEKDTANGDVSLLLNSLINKPINALHDISQTADSKVLAQEISYAIWLALS